MSERKLTNLDVLIVIVIVILFAVMMKACREYREYVNNRLAVGVNIK